MTDKSETDQVESRARTGTESRQYLTRYHHIGYRRCSGRVHSVIVSTSMGVEWSLWEIPVESTTPWSQRTRVIHGLRFDELIAKCGRVYQDIDLTVPCITAAAITKVLRSNARRKARHHVG